MSRVFVLILLYSEIPWTGVLADLDRPLTGYATASLENLTIRFPTR